MRTNTSPASRPANHPPLAHDAKGNAQPVPDGAAFWLLKRETGGRPKTIVGTDRQPVRFALTTTVDDIETMLGDGTFRVHALNEVGEMIDYVCTLVVGDDDSEADEAPSRQVSSWPVANNNTDSLHHALQTITAMAKAQSEALCQVSEAQADFLKGLASAKALPRNAWGNFLPPNPPLIPPSEDDDDSDDGEEEEEEEEEEEPDKLTQLATALGPLVPICIDMWKGKGPSAQRNGAPEPAASTKPEPEAAPKPPEPPPPAPAPAPAPGPNPLLHLAKIQAELAPDELRFLAHLLSGARAEAYSDALLSISVDQAVTEIRLLRQTQRERRAAKAERLAVERDDAVVAATPSVVDPVSPAIVESADQSAGHFMAHVLAVRAHLKPKEQAAVMALMPRLTVERMEALKIQLLRMAPKEAATWIKANLASLRAEVES